MGHCCVATVAEAREQVKYLKGIFCLLGSKGRKGRVEEGDEERGIRAYMEDKTNKQTKI